MKKRCEHGFTLVELMIVMVIVGILAAVAAPNLKKFLNKDRLRASTSEVTSAFYLARMRAVNQGLPCGVKFITGGTFYVVNDPKGTPTQHGAPHSLEPGVSIVSNTFTDGLAIFNEYGQLDRVCLPTGSMTAAVRLNDGSIDTTKVEVTFISGRIRVTNR